jgi:hypothetical protein
MLKNKQNLILYSCFIIIILQIVILVNENPIEVEQLKVNTAQPDQQEECDTHAYTVAVDLSEKSISSSYDIQFDKIANLVTKTIANEISKYNAYQLANINNKREPSQNEILVSNQNYQIIESQMQGITKYSSKEDVENIHQLFATLIDKDKERYQTAIGLLYTAGKIQDEDLRMLLP